MRTGFTLAVIIFACLSFAAYAEEPIDIYYSSFSFSKQELQYGKQGQYDQLLIKGCEYWDKEGEPQLPVYPASLALPAGAQLERVEVVKANSQLLPGYYELFPAQAPVPLSIAINQGRLAQFSGPKAEIYQANSFFPDKLFQITGTGQLAAQPVVNLLIFPVQYNPVQGKVVLYSYIRLKVSFTAPETKASLRTPGKPASPWQQLFQHNVMNPEAFQPMAAEIWRAEQRQLTKLQLSPGDYKYVVITTSAYETEFQTLADWKTKKGIPAKVVLVDWINTNYSGVDLQERIRNFIKDALVSWGTIYVLLGGDTDVVPERTVFAMESGMGANRDDIRCDLYYSDLDGTFNGDGDGVFGEVEDQIDLYPEVFVGRAPINTVTEAQTFVAKVLTYEKNPPSDYLLTGLFAAEIEADSPVTDSSESAEFIDDQYFPPRFDPITKLYQSTGNENPTTVINALNMGHHFINHTGHAWYDRMRVGGSGNYIYSGSMSSLTNGTKYGIIYSTGCWPAAIDYDCIAERFVNNPNGGGIAFIGNSRYGWFSPGNPLFGHSDRFNHWFYKTIFQDGIYRLGEVLANVKSHFIPWSREENVYRWHQYELNLLGDPEIPVWTDIPQPLTVVHPAKICGGESPLPITVLCNSIPSSGALICVLKRDEVYEYGYTDLKGQITLPVHPVTEGTIGVTVTAQNCLPYEGSVTVDSSFDYVGISRMEIDDDDIGQSHGNGDGLVNPGEWIEWQITLKNFGGTTINGTSATLQSSDPSVVLIGEQHYGNLAPGEEATGTFLISINQWTAHNADVYLFSLTVSDQGQGTWSYQPGLYVASPELRFSAYSLDDLTGGDGDGIPEAGETVSLFVTLRNTGLGIAYNVTAYLGPPNSQYIDYLNDSVFYGNFTAGQESTGSMPFTVQIAADCPSPHFATLPISITGDGFTYRDESLMLAIGDVGFSDDLESGIAPWTLEGTNNLWHLSSHRVHSANNSWYCGHEGTYVYDNYMNCSIISPEITLEPNSILCFWRWYEVATYGTNGLYVELYVDGAWQELDFIGSGGALNSKQSSKSICSDWFQERYDLSLYHPNTKVRLRFRFVSDNEPPEEGFYIDDISIRSTGQPYFASADTNWSLYY